MKTGRFFGMLLFLCILFIAGGVVDATYAGKNAGEEHSPESQKKTQKKSSTRQPGKNNAEKSPQSAYKSLDSAVESFEGEEKDGEYPTVHRRIPAEENPTPVKPGATPGKPEKKPRQKNPDEIELGGNRFLTSDMVQLNASFYPGNANKETVPIVLLHGHGKDREEFNHVLPEFKKHGFAVLIPDLRGHGASTSRYIPQNSRFSAANNARNENDRVQPHHSSGSGFERNPFSRERRETQNPPPEPVPTGRRTPQLDDQYTHDTFVLKDYERMMVNDPIPFQRFLVECNNKEKLNLNKLVILGIDMGGTVGGFWAKMDWEKYKRKNTKTLIIITPNHDLVIERLFKDSKLFREQMSVLFMVGERDKAAFERAFQLRENILGKDKDKESYENYNSWDAKIPLLTFPTDLQGRELLSSEKLKIPQKVAEYINIHTAELKERETRWKRF